MIFHAVGYLWKKKLPNGKPQRLTDGKDFEYEPRFSPDGNKLVYVTWNDETKGQIKTMKSFGRRSKNSYYPKKYL